MENTNTAAAVQQVSVKVPPFMETAVPAWFKIMEAQFHLARIVSSQTKFYHALSSLPPDVITRVPAAAIEDEDYPKLKDAIISSYEQTKPELFERLISTTTMTGRPSIFLQDISNAAKKLGITDDLVRHKFVQALPSSISPVVATQKELSLQQLGKLADELMPLAQSQCLAVQPEVTSKSPSSSTSSTRTYSSIPTGIRPFNSNQRPVVCRAHIYFGEKARTCKPWCRWPNKKNTSMLPSSRPSSPAPASNNSEN